MRRPKPPLWRRLAVAKRGAYLRYDDDEPRDDDGKWTDGGGGGDSGSESEAESTGSGAGEGHAGSSPKGVSGGAGQGSHGQSSGAYSGASNPRSGGRGRLNGAEVTHTYTPTEAHPTAAENDAGATPLTFHELGEGGGETFHKAIDAAKAASPNGAAVTLYSADEYDHMRTFLADDGKAGFALKGDDIISVFRDPSSKSKGAVTSILALATQLGGKRLDCFDTALPSMYARCGFKAVGRTPFNDEYKPPGWDYDKFKAYNNGRPDVVFMIRDPKVTTYKAGEGKSYDDYDAAMEAQKAAVKESRAASLDTRSETEMKIKPKGWKAGSAAHRFADVTPSTYDAKARSVEAILSRGSAVQRFYGTEKLRIAQDAVMLDRMKSSGIPLLDSHNQHGIDNALGRIEKVWFTRDGAMVGLIVFNDTPRGREAEGMVARGELSGISVGYIVREWEVTDKDGSIIDPEIMRINFDDDLTFEATRWELLEASLVSVPADAEAYVRSLDGDDGKHPFEGHFERNASKITVSIGDRSITYEYPDTRVEASPPLVQKGNEDVRARMQARQSMLDRMRS